MSNKEICSTDAVTLAGLIRSKKLSPVEVLDAIIDRIEKLEPVLHAFCTPTPEAARAEAKRIEAEIMVGKPVGSLAGIPIGIKDLVCTKGVRTVSGSLAYVDFIALDVSDFSTIISKIQQRKPDVVMSLLVGSSHDAFYG